MVEDAESKSPTPYKLYSEYNVNLTCPYFTQQPTADVEAKIMGGLSKPGWRYVPAELYVYVQMVLDKAFLLLNTAMSDPNVIKEYNALATDPILEIYSIGHTKISLVDFVLWTSSDLVRMFVSAELLLSERAGRAPVFDRDPLLKIFSDIETDSLDYPSIQPTDGSQLAGSITTAPHRGATSDYTDPLTDEFQLAGSVPRCISAVTEQEHSSGNVASDKFHEFLAYLARQDDDGISASASLDLKLR